jgi:hypothetical protein
VHRVARLYDGRPSRGPGHPTGYVDLTAGSTVLVSANQAGSGAGNGETYRGTLSADGRSAGFSSGASDLVVADSNGEVNDVFLRDLGRGRTTLVTRSASGAGGNGLSWAAAVPAGDMA